MIRHAKTLAALCLTVALCLGSAGAFARSWVMGADWHYPPHQYLDEHGNPAGFDVDVFRAVAEAKGVDVDFYMGKWTGVQEKLSSGEVDVVPMFVSPARRQKYAFSDPFMNEYYILLARQGRGGYGSLDDVSGESVAIQQGGFIWDYVRQHHPHLNLVVTQSEPDAVRKVAQQEADLALVSVHLGTYVVAKQRYEHIIMASQPLVSADYAFAVAPENQQLLAGINAALRQIRADGTYDQIYKKWVANLDEVYNAYRQGWFHSLGLIIPLGILALVLLVSVIRFRSIAANLRTWSKAQFKRAKQAEEQATRLAQFDSLTNMPKRRLFEDYLESAIKQAARAGDAVGVGFVNITDFSKIQQIAGFNAADKVTKAVAQQLYLHANETVFISHFDSGKFGLIVQNRSSNDAIYNEIYKTVSEAEIRVNVDEFPIDVNLSCGLAFYPEHGTTAEEIVLSAELASGFGRIRRNSLVVFEPRMRPDPRQMVMMSDLRDAIRQDILGWAFQPKFSLKDKRMIGAEMLVRWNHPRYGAIAPDLFIPLAEETGAIRDLTRHVIHKAGQFCSDWQDRHLELGISVNVSGNDLADPRLVEEILHSFENICHRLTLEITETAMVEDISAILDNVSRLREHKISIALDDYGTGYSSLKQLSRLKPDEIKIDQCFIKTLCNSVEDEKIVQASIQLGHELGALVIAEGVEDRKVYDKLMEMGCDAVQGYGIATPMPAYEFLQYCRQPRLALMQS